MQTKKYKRAKRSTCYSNLISGNKSNPSALWKTLNEITLREQSSPISQGPFINYGPGGAGGKLGGEPRKKNHDKEGGLPKLFCLMAGA